MARGSLGMDEILESVGMVGRDHLDIRTVTLGVDLRGCRTPEDVVRRMTSDGGRARGRHGCHRRPDRCAHRQPPRRGHAHRLGRRASRPGADPGPRARHRRGCRRRSGSTSSGASRNGREERLAVSTRRRWPPPRGARGDRSASVRSVNVATTGAGINMDAVGFMGEVIQETAERTADRLAASAAPSWSSSPTPCPTTPSWPAPSTASARVTRPSRSASRDRVWLTNALRRLPAGAPLHELAEGIKRTVFKITRVGEHVGREVARRLEVRLRRGRHLPRADSPPVSERGRDPRSSSASSTSACPVRRSPWPCSTMP